MHRVQCSNHRRKGFACSLKNLLRDGVDGEAFMGNLYIAHQLRDSGIGFFLSYLSRSTVLNTSTHPSALLQALFHCPQIRTGFGSCKRTRKMTEVSTYTIIVADGRPQVTSPRRPFVEA